MDRLIRVMAAVVLSAALSGGVAAQTVVLHVDAASTATSPDGTAWQKAFRSLGPALATANAVPGSVVEVRVAQGTYKPDESDGPGAGTGNRTATFSLARANLAVRGGYRGRDGMGSPDERDPARFETVLSGDLGENDGPDFANYGDNSHHVVTISFFGAGAASLEGVTIRGGNATDAANPAGGGLLAQAPSFEIMNVRIESCQAQRGGGAMFAPSLTGALVRECTIVGNRATGSVGGGGAIAQGSLGLRIEDCFIEENDALAGPGGGLVIPSGGVTLVGVVVRGNTASGDGGGVKIDGSNAMSLLNCALIGNHSSMNGGGLWGRSDPLEVQQTIVSGNTAGLNGGGMAFGQDPTSDVIVANCRVFGNTAAFDGGGLHIEARDCVVLNTVVNGNTAMGDGGGVVSSSCAGPPSVNHTITSSTIVGNTAAQQGGGILRLFSSQSSNPSIPRLRVENTIVAQNMCGGVSECGQAARFEKCPSGSPNTSNGEAQFRSSCVEGSVSLSGFVAGVTVDSLIPPTENLVGVLPGFESALAGFDMDLGTADDVVELGAGAACLDMGSTLLLADDLADLNGMNGTSDRLPFDALLRPRESAGTMGSSARVDIGALERPAPGAAGGERAWLYALDGDWQDALWWTWGAPVESSTVRFGAPGAYEVRLRADAAVSRILAHAGDITLHLGGDTLDVGEVDEPPVVIAEHAGESASMRVHSGLGMSSSVLIGREAGAWGSLRLDGAGTEWLASGEVNVGLSGAGSMTIEDGARLTSLYGFVGAQPGSEGAVVVDGDGSKWRAQFVLSVSRGEVALRNGGEIHSGLGFFGGTIVDSRGRLSGEGTARGNLLNFGEVSPGVRRERSSLETAEDLGTLAIAGSYFQLGELDTGGDNTGTMSVRIGGAPEDPAIDLLDISGSTQLAGGLLVSFLDGFQADDDGLEGLALLRAAEIGGSFDVALLPLIPGGESFLIVQQTVVDGDEALVLRVLPLADSIDVGADSTFTTEFAPARAVAGDLDLDGDIDLALGIPGPTEGAPDAPGSVVVLLNGGTMDGEWMGFFLGANAQFSVGAPLTGLTLVQANGDGAPDIAVTTLSVVDPDGPGAVRVLLNDGDASFALLPQAIAVGAAPSAITSSDFDGDGKEDLAATNSLSDSVTLLRNTSGGGSVSFGQPFTVGVGAGPSGLAVTDFDGDLDGDLIVANRIDGTITVLRNREEQDPFWNSGQFVPSATAQAGDDPDSVLPGSDDDEKKGGLEEVQFLVVVNRGVGAVTVLAHLGNGTFAPGVSLPVGDRALSAAVTDLDEDGDLDIAVAVEDALGNRSARLLRNDTVEGGPLTFAAGGEIPGVTAEPLIVLAEDVDGDGDSDLIALGSPGSGTQAVALGEDPPAPSIVPLLSVYCPEDVNGDQFIDFGDLNVVLSAFNTAAGEMGFDVRADVDRDGDVDFADLNVVVSGPFNAACPATRPR